MFAARLSKFLRCLIDEAISQLRIDLDEKSLIKYFNLSSSDEFSRDDLIASSTESSINSSANISSMGVKFASIPASTGCSRKMSMQNECIVEMFAETN